MTKKPTLGQVLVMAGGALTFIFGFLAWISGGGQSFNAWSSDANFFPTYTWVPILTLAVGILVAVKAFGSLPEKLWIYTLNQIVIVVGAGSLLTVLSFLVTDKHGASTGVGAILSIFTTAAVLAGGILDELGVATDVFAGAGGGGSASPGYPQQPWGQPGQPPAQPGWGQPPAPQAPPQPPAAPQAPPPAPGTGQAPPPPPPPASSGF